jgi:hypothetical protein
METPFFLLLCQLQTYQLNFLDLRLTIYIIKVYNALYDSYFLGCAMYNLRSGILCTRV